VDLRFDRLATLYVVSPLLRLGGSSERSVPILMYHSIADEDESGVHAYYRTKTSPAMFSAQLKCLNDSGYKVCTLDQARRQLQDHSHAMPKLAVITFDDGYADFYREAFPVMNRYGFTATVYLPTAFIRDSPTQFKRKDCLTWAEVRELHKHGVSFGSHTVNHPQLRQLSFPAINHEIGDSKKTIEDKLGCTVDSFAYPYAFPQTDTAFRQRLRESLREAGYQHGVCTLVGRANCNSDPLFMERLPVNSCDDLALFQAKLAGSYDWVAKPQLFAKLTKNRVRRSV
jgi:peptidoglycan/xylan/chitin deacetylase (PgdA/CDA1 family)